MRSNSRLSQLIWISMLALTLAISSSVAANRYIASDQSSTTTTHPHAQTDTEQDWNGSRSRCVICHVAHNHDVMMAHPVAPTCRSCHSGSPNRVGCPTCHSMHDVDYPHETYPTCDECHTPQENVTSADVQETAVGYLAYMFSDSGFFPHEEVTGSE